MASCFFLRVTLLNKANVINLLLNYFKSLFFLTAEMAPYLLLGFLIAGVLHVYVPKGLFTKWFGKNNLKSVFYASIMGIPLPLCSCGVIPTGISLYKEGASKGATVSFLISTPQTGVDSIMVTYSLLGLPFAIIRPFIALITGVFGGWFVNMADRKNTHDPVLVEEESPVQKGNALRRIFSYAFDEFLSDIADWLVIGLTLAGLIAVLIPESFFESTILSNEWSSMIIVLIASIPFYVCATGSVPIAAVLLLKGLNPGAVLVFLMAGPATNIATMTVISKTLGKKTLFIYLSSIVLGAFGFGLVLNHFFPADFFAIIKPEGSHHGSSIMKWIEISSAALFIFFLLRIYLGKINQYFIKKKGMGKTSNQVLELQVEGMSCENCASKVKTALLAMEDINETQVNLESKKVEIKGNDIDFEEVKSTIEKSGYRVNSKTS